MRSGVYVRVSQGNLEEQDFLKMEISNTESLAERSTSSNKGEKHALSEKSIQLDSF